jgi:hypothetical protein
VTILASQMIWIVGNVPDCQPVETFSAQLITPAPLLSHAQETTPSTPNTSDPGSSSSADDDSTFSTDVPQTLEHWAESQQNDPDFAPFISKLSHVATRDNLHVHAPPDKPPRIIVPPSSVQTPLVRHAHVKMWHLGPRHAACSPPVLIRPQERGHWNVSGTSSTGTCQAWRLWIFKAKELRPLARVRP